MSNPLHRRISSAAILIACGGFAGAAAGETAAPFPDTDRLCFARVYDQTHLAQHPKQRVSRLHLALARGKGLSYWRTPAAAASEMNPKTRENSPDENFDPAHRHVAVFVTLRGAGKPEEADGECSPASENQKAGPLRCSAECDRGIGRIAYDAEKGVMFDQVEPLLLSDPVEEADAGDSKLKLGADDDKFRLEARPVEECLAEARRASPISEKLGEPLRVRLKPDAPFCFGRDYSPEHLAAHPRQKTVSIRVSRSAEIIERARAKRELDDWPSSANVLVTFTTRANGRALTMRYSCDPDDAAWNCSRAMCDKDDCAKAELDLLKSTHCDEEDATASIYLRRGPGATMMLGNPHAALPLDGSCHAKAKSDDLSFRLEPMPMATCASSP